MSEPACGSRHGGGSGAGAVPGAAGDVTMELEDAG